MDDRRLRKWSGMDDCRTVLRSTAEITSAQPATASSAMAIHRVSTKPNTVIAAPHTTTAMITARASAA